MAKSVTKRVLDSFGTGDDAAAQDYDGKVYERWNDLAATLRRNAVIMLLVAALFELLIYQAKPNSITFGSFTVANSPVVQISLPIIFAFLVYEGCHLTTRMVDVEAIYFALVEKASPKADENDLAFLIRPVLPGFWAVGSSASSGVAQRSENFHEGLRTVIGIIVVFVFPLAFEGQAYYKLFQRFGYHDIFLWVSVGLSISLLICTIIYYLIYGNEDL
jgi:hypothetical protein